MPTTFRALIRPIPSVVNLSNVQDEAAALPCEQCQRIVPDRRQGGGVRMDKIKTSYERIITFPDFPELKEAKCRLCRLLRKTIRSQWAVRPMEELGVSPLVEDIGIFDDLLETEWDGKVRVSNVCFSLERPSYGDDGSAQGEAVSLMFFVVGPANTPLGDDGEPLHGTICQTLSFKVYDSVDLHCPDERVRRRIPSASTLSDRNIELMASWIQECKAGHMGCFVDRVEWLPTRLLKIESTSEDGGLSLRLVVTAAEGPGSGGGGGGAKAASRSGSSTNTQSQRLSTPYAALSHMWGDITISPPLRTILSNVNSLKDNIDLEALPLNFYHSVLVCEALGIHYLWIDSLCIVQDDAKDWDHEAGLMHLVYKFAEVTIVATTATSSHDGFLARDTYKIPATKVAYQLDGDNANATVCNSMVLCPLDNVETGLRSGDVDGSEWNRRGWTMQERSLSTRLIHFCRNKLYFECRGCLRSEEGEPGKSWQFNMWPRVVSGQQSPYHEDRFQLWHKMVGQYSNRKLTHGSDKLQAIQSLGAEMGSGLGDDTEYIPFAGMWKRNLHLDLLWAVKVNTRVSPPYRAPSWSWASLDAQICFNIGTRNISPDLAVEARLARSLAHPFEVRRLGRSRSLKDDRDKHFLEVKTLTKPVTRIVAPQKKGDAWGSYWGGVDRFSFPHDAIIGDGEVVAHVSLDLVGSGEEPKSDGSDGPGQPGAEAKNNQSAALHLARPAFLYAHVSNEHNPSGLMLQRSSEDIEGREAWVRIGVATIFRRYETAEPENAKGGPISEQLLREEDEMEARAVLIL